MKPDGSILILDDDVVARRSLHGELYAAGYAVMDAGDIDEAVALSRILCIDVVVLGFSLEGTGMVDTCSVVRSHYSNASVLVVSQCADPERKIEALDAGADDYLVRPFDVRELIARIRVVMRRARTATKSAGKIITIGDITLDPERRSVFKAGSEVHLTPKEFSVLHYLMEHPGFPIPHSSLLTALWGPEYANQVEYLRTLIRQLRIKLSDAVNPKYLLTDSHVGYHFVDESKVKSSSLDDIGSHC